MNIHGYKTWACAVYANNSRGGTLKNHEKVGVSWGSF
jgi:hypothetical protein